MAVPTLTRMAVGLTNLPSGGTRTYAALIEEAGAGTYVFDVFVPAGAIIQGLGAQTDVVWGAGSAAALVVGDYNVAAGGGLGSELDLDGFIASTSVKATDLTAAQSITLLGAGQGGKAGAYNAGSNTHWNNLVSAVDRWLRFSITASGTNATAGRTRLWAEIAYPVLNVVSQA